MDASLPTKWLHRALCAARSATEQCSHPPASPLTTPACAADPRCRGHLAQAKELRSGRAARVRPCASFAKAYAVSADPGSRPASAWPQSWVATRKRWSITNRHWLRAPSDALHRERRACPSRRPKQPRTPPSRKPRAPPRRLSCLRASRPRRTRSSRRPVRRPRFDQQQQPAQRADRGP